MGLRPVEEEAGATVTFDVLVAGGGPAGLAAGIAAARAGASVQVHERRFGPLDKACGEGLMPEGVAFLEEMGVLSHLGRAAPFEGIRYVQEDGSLAVGRFPKGKVGLGIRRPILHGALIERALAMGVEIREGSAVRGFSPGQGHIRLHTERETVRGRLLVVADGLSSGLRRQAGLDGAPGEGRRFGVRRHFRSPGAGDPGVVEVHFGAGVEAYLTPVGGGEVGLAFLWDPSHVGALRFPELLTRFPSLASRWEGASPSSEVRGAGPLFRRVRRRIAERLVLVGDAAGYVDALTGEGVSLAFAGAADLGRALPRILAEGATTESLLAWERRAALRYAAYAGLAQGLLFLTRHPPLRRQVVRALGRWPGLFGGALRLVC